MTKGALALLVSGGTENWAPERWRERFTRVCPDRPVALIPDDAIDPALVRYAAVWKPKPGALARFPNLGVIFNLGAGVDAVVADATLPDVPLVRVAVDDLTQRMTEYVVMHVLMHHRRQGYYAESQRNKLWAPKLQWAASELRVGVMGLGVLGRDAAEVLARIGFDVAGWSSTREVDPGNRSASRARPELDPFLARTDVLVCLLPLTPEHARHPQPPHLRAARARRQARRAGHHQCGPRRTAERGRPAGGARRRHPAGRDARRVSHRAAAAGQPVLVASEGDALAAQCRRHRSRTTISDYVAEQIAAYRARREAHERGRSQDRVLARLERLAQLARLDRTARLAVGASARPAAHARRENNASRALAARCGSRGFPSAQSRAAR